MADEYLISEDLDGSGRHQFELLHWKIPERTEKNQEKPQSG
jgi:hypothetical protein